jgi:hypothetical protein
LPAPLPVNNVAETQFVMQGLGRTVSCRAFWSDGAALGYTLGDVQALGAALESSWHTNVMALLTNECTFQEIITTDLTTNSSPRDTRPSGTTGAQDPPCLPLNVAMVLKFDIPTRYRGGKNHIFIPFLPIGVRTTEDYWNAAIITDMDNAWTAVVASASSLTTSHSSHWFQVGVSRFHAHARRDPPVVEPISGFEVQSRLCTRRRRLPKITV